MKAEKIRNLTDDELRHQERELNDQLFKLKFQLNMGQTESLKKIRGTAQGHRAGQDHRARACRCWRRARRRSNGGDRPSRTRPCTNAARWWWARWSRPRCRRPSWWKWSARRRIRFYGRVISKRKKFYAHDEKNEAHVGDVVRLEETRPLSKLKRWRLKEVVRKTALVAEPVAATDVAS